MYGELLDLQAGELLPADVDPLEIAEELGRRYESLWQELTREEILRPEEQRYRIAERLHRLNELGFDADEVELISTGEGNKLRLKTRVAESGHDSQEAVPAHRDRRRGEPGPPAAQRHGRRSGPGWSRSRAGRCPRSWRPTGGWRRSTTR